MAKRCDLMVHHGGHSSVMTGLMAGTPAVIIPTIAERVSSARRLAAVGAGEVVMPVAGADGEKRIDVAEFARKASLVLNEPSSPGYSWLAGTSTGRRRVAAPTSYLARSSRLHPPAR
jgi:predicted glycosyltransferase